MARIDTKNISDNLKLVIEEEAEKRNISLNTLSKEIFEDYAKNKYSFETEKRYTESINKVTVALNKNTETLEKYIESNMKLINALLD